MDAEALAVVDGVVHGVDLELAGVARTRVYLADREASPEPASDDLLQLDADLFEFRIGNGWERLGNDAGMENLFKDADHTAPNIIRNSNI